MSPTRRTVLKYGLVSGLVAACGGAALALQETLLRSPLPKLVALDAKTYSVLAALADRLVPAAGDGAPGATRLKIAETIDQLLSVADADAREGMKGALAMFENALPGALVGERLRPFTKLSPEQQDAVIVSFRDSRIGVRRTIFHALAGAVFAMYWGNPETWRRIGYEGPPSVASLRELYRENLVDLDSLRATPLTQGA